MAVFTYTARTKDNSIQNGSVNAKDRATALTTLKDRGLIPILVKKPGATGEIHIKIPGLGSKVKARDIVIFTRELSTMINAGVPIVKCLHTLRDQTESAQLHKTLDVVTAKVEGGAPLSDALEEHPKVFSLVYVNMVRAGETGGILDKILDRLAIQVEKDADMKGKLRGALIYPSVILVMTVGAFVFLMTGIIPKLKDIFDQFGAELPLNTRIMLGMSNIMQKYGIFIGIAAAGLVFLFIRIIHQPKGKLRWDKLLLKMPIFGKITLKINVARFSRTFSSLAAAGVPVLDGLNVTSQSLTNSIISRGIREAAQKVKNGQPISTSIEETKVFPPIVNQMLEVGEETGQVDKVLNKIADFYEQEVDRVMANLTSLMEPVIIIVLGAVVGLIIASIFGPISQLTNVVK